MYATLRERLYDTDALRLSLPGWIDHVEADAPCSRT